MNSSKNHYLLYLLLAAVCFLAPSLAHASTNISTSTTEHWAWNDDIGWINFASTNNVIVTSTGIAGDASSSVGYISLDCHTSPIGNICGTSNYQVLNDGNGNLSGWAWNDAIGWVSFCGTTGASSSGCPTVGASYEVTIDSGGDFQGWAWNDVVGWIDFNCGNAGGGGCSGGAGSWYVNTSWEPPSAETGYLDSTTFDTASASGSQLNSVLWYGTQPGGTSVGFQFAVSNNSSGPWNYTGPDDTSSTYYTSAIGPSTAGNLEPIPLSYSLYSGYRYFRYRTILTSDLLSAGTPEVSEVVVNWSP